MNFDKHGECARANDSNQLLPTAIVLADKLVYGELSEIFGKIESSSLIIAGRTVVDHTLLELQALGFEQCIVLAGNNSEEIQTSVNNDNYQGMSVNVMNYACTTEQVLREFKTISDPCGMLVIESDKIREHCISTFLTQVEASEYSLLEAKGSFGSLGLTMLKKTTSDFIINPLPVILHGIRVNHLQTASDFHVANFEVVAGGFSGLEPSVAISAHLGRRLHWDSSFLSASEIDWREVMIERHCRVGNSVSLDSVILNNDVYVENHASIKNTIVMPHSIVSARRPLNNSIVNEGVVYQLS
jgi:hypothetical protein